jgi:hypothetical protein
MVDNNYKKLKEYYKRVCAPLVFVGEYKLDNCKDAKVYLYDFKKDEELQNFKKLFQEYLPFYVKNFDRIDRYRLSENDVELGNYLRNKARNIKFNETSIPQRNIENNGLYGEIFNDFYLRNVLTNERLITYLSRRSYERPNSENRGIDLVVCTLKNDSLEISLSEAKFVKNISAARSDLINDVGKHIKVEYINDFLQFVLQKQGDAINEREIVINEKVNEFNDLIEDEGISFIEAVNRKNYSIKFIYFAIFNNEDRTALIYENRAKEIINEFNEKIQSTGINNYCIEVVFIPTFNGSMVLKQKMEEWDE